MKQYRKTYYECLYDLSETLHLAGSPEAVLHSIVEGVATAMGAKGCSLVLLTPNGELLRHAAYGLSDWFVGALPASDVENIALMAEGEPVAVLDAAAADDRIEYQAHLRREGIASILSVPMQERDGVLGIMRVYTSEPRGFSDDAIAFAKAAANFGAIALENARFYESLEKDYETRREEMLQERAEIGDEWMTEEDVVPPEEVAIAAAEKPIHIPRELLSVAQDVQ